jgi:hypothetical protein
VPDQAAALSLNSQYAAQLASDLERVVGQIEELEVKLTALQTDRALLERMRGSLEDVPEPRTALDDTVAAAAGAAGRLRVLPEQAARPQDSSGRGQRKPRSKRGPAMRSGMPTLRDLAARHLLEQREPRSAAEVAASLAEAHPGRNMSVPLVRNAIESHVAQGLVVRSKQGRAVFYSAAEVVAPEQAASGAEPAAE